MVSLPASRRTTAATIGLVLLVVLNVYLWGFMGRGSDDHPELSPRPPSGNASDVFASPTDETTGPEDEASTTAAPDGLLSALDGLGGSPPPGRQSRDATRTYVVTSTSNGGLSGVGWRVVYGDHSRTAQGVSSFRDTHTSHDPRAFAQVIAIGNASPSRVECTIAIDGAVVAHDEASGPWAQVYCQA